MNQANEFGRLAEEKATAYLKKNNYEICERNYRYLKAEIDIIARKGDTLVIVEVKARTSSYFGNPETFITQKKIQLLVKAANHYVIEKDLDVEVRFDVISILNEYGNFKIEHIENAFFHH